jgi:hypothetical protein
MDTFPLKIFFEGIDTLLNMCIIVCNDVVRPLRARETAFKVSYIQPFREARPG